MSRRHPNARTSTHRYPRTARLNTLFRQILADEMERMDDDRLVHVAITAVDVDRDLRHAKVFFDCLDTEQDSQTVAVLMELRLKLQAAIGREARVKRVPELSFGPDPAIRSGERIDEILRRVESHEEPG